MYTSYTRSRAINCRRPPELRAFEVAFAEPDAIVEEMVRRRAAFARALETGDPSGLPRCEWYERTCDYREICGCEEAEQLLGPVVPSGAAEIVENAELAAELEAKLAEAPLFPERPGFGLNDLVFPRKAAFERSEARAEAKERQTGDSLKGIERWGFKRALDQAIRYGAKGAFSRTRVELRGLGGWVNLHYGMPTLLRDPGWSQMVERRRLPAQFPYYFDRLAFECALSGRERGRLVLYYKALEGDKFMVYDMSFKDLDAIRAEADRRLALLEAGAPPEELPPCPAWMAKFCDYAPACGCADRR